ncbi:MAG: hypothetical protein TREMPRED_001611 [Tremellales sp. Tagirdzhanova-0007]|nr:MAG: hypothetical protein TREMPRED_001611 [Tremellales sp. Tagirdzhanova-0007]
MSRPFGEVLDFIAQNLTGKSAASIADSYLSLHTEKPAVANYILQEWAKFIREEISKNKRSKSELHDDHKKLMDLSATLESRKTSLQTLLQSDKSSGHELIISGEELSSLAAMSNQDVTSCLKCLCRSGLSGLAHRFLDGVQHLSMDELRTGIRSAASEQEEQECIEKGKALGNRMKELGNQMATYFSDDPYVG